MRNSNTNHKYHKMSTSSNTEKSSDLKMLALYYFKKIKLESTQIMSSR